MPEIDEIVKKGQEQLKVLMGGRRGSGGGGNGGGFGGGDFRLNRFHVGIGAVVVVGLWLYASLYTVKPEEQSVELFLGKYSHTGDPGLNFAPWPLVKYVVVPTTRERSEDIGTGRGTDDNGLMLTTDENIVDIDFQVVWNISDPSAYLFNLRDPPMTVRSVSESAMREIIARSSLSPILNRDRGLIQDQALELIQSTLDSYKSGIHVIRVNLDKADPPSEVIDSFRQVQAAEQERDRLERQADAYSNRVMAGARGEAAQVLEEAEAYRAQAVNQAQGDASRFESILKEYKAAPDVTRERLYLDTMQQVLAGTDKVIIDTPSTAGTGPIPLLPLTELFKAGTATTPVKAPPAAGSQSPSFPTTQTRN